MKYIFKGLELKLFINRMIDEPQMTMTRANWCIYSHTVFCKYRIEQRTYFPTPDKINFTFFTPVRKINESCIFTCIIKVFMPCGNCELYRLRILYRVYNPMIGLVDLGSRMNYLTNVILCVVCYLNGL